MSEKNLSGKEWKTFSAARSLKAPAFSRALASLEKSATPAQVLEAVAEVGKQAAALRQAHRSDKELHAYLDGLDRALALRRKSAEAKGPGKPGKDDDEDDEPDAPVLLTARMPPLLRRVRQGQRMPVLVATVGQRAVLLMAPRPIANTRRKLLTEYLAAGTPRFFKGHCEFEDNAYTFVMETSASGMAKKLKAAVLVQAGLRVKVRVRGPDPADDEEDLEIETETDTETDSDMDADSDAGAPADAGRHPGAPPTASPVSPLAPAVTAASQALTARLSGIKAVLQQARADGGDEARAAGDLLLAVQLAARRHDYDEAQRAIDRFERAMQSLRRPALTAEQATALRAALTTEYMALRPGFSSQLALGAADPDWFASQRLPARNLRDTLDRLTTAGDATDPDELRRSVEALKRLTPVVTDMNTKRDALTLFHSRQDALVALALALPATGQPAMAQAQAALRAALARIVPATPLADVSPAATQRLIDAAQSALAAVQQALADDLLVRAMGRDKSALRAELAASPDVLKLVADRAEGRKLLDTLMADLGTTARGAADNGFVRQALNARYDAKFLGDLDASAGPRLYRVFGRMPESHTLFNDKIAHVKRNRNYKPASWYTIDADPGEGVGRNSIVINGVRTGGVKGWATDLIANTSPVTRYRNVQGDRAMNAFDATTLHEIGHGVDEKIGFMDRQGSQSQYGGWQSHTATEVADAVGTHTGFFSSFAAQPHDMLQRLLEHALAPGFSIDRFRRGAAAAGAGAATQSVTGAEWSAMGRHRAIDFCQAIRLKGKSGLWEKGDGASRFALAGRVYQESYEGDWCSYEFAARAICISHYQFRAAGEWFAEAYAAFYQNKLPDQHPLTAVLMAQA